MKALLRDLVLNLVVSALGDAPVWWVFCGLILPIGALCLVLEWLKSR